MINHATWQNILNSILKPFHRLPRGRLLLKGKKSKVTLSACFLIQPNSHVWCFTRATITSCFCCFFMGHRLCKLVSGYSGVILGVQCLGHIARGAPPCRCHPLVSHSEKQPCGTSLSHARSLSRGGLAPPTSGFMPTSWSDQARSEGLRAPSQRSGMPLQNHAGSRWEVVSATETAFQSNLGLQINGGGWASLPALPQSRAQGICTPCSPQVPH